ncbi:VIT1/CCC1 transporter family protein [Brevundimonas fontaquae]|uniref:VIT family protein n=1 Tax=Brevundimonas fontaquae TaxID=2813778 RepID=A0ABX7LUZ6_9CAUL|nr:VIT family protein [Brevundimonas fontaquae]QSF55614.1 VIT family protein [Brevundimonas fontaquae]
MSRTHLERHLIARIGWLRAAVLGANDGLLSTSSLIVGVAASGAPKAAVLVSGVAGLVAGAMSMAAGEYVSVSSQSDTEKADLAREAAELAAAPEAERDELAAIYVERGVQPETARAVAEQLMAHDSLGAHARDELGISSFTMARPVQAALTSAATFAAGAALPLATVALAPTGGLLIWVAASAVAGLIALGALGARAGGADIGRSVVRVVFWGVLAMAVTAVIGRVFGTVV